MLTYLLVIDGTHKNTLIVLEGNDTLIDFNFNNLDKISCHEDETDELSPAMLNNLLNGGFDVADDDEPPFDLVRIYRKVELKPDNREIYVNVLSDEITSV